ncbi:MAG TPA: nucleoside deaminase [Candidatus Limadaptatus stercoripullorum]|uniref:tRNA-specific adenosine deaminase n=1 Tax=Candidatus Limadaptatus stercoripullorum TaxID=2840846 RepID=A0A9D1SVZ8_9FIRM|nr:nucleoside deaminase [Candidatus Limadaptatus stercoripullorum]
MTRDEKFMREALRLAAECAAEDEVPVGCVVVRGDEIVAGSGNRKEREGSATRHAEMVALESAARALGNWWLEDCEVFVTLEPCPMCAHAMTLSRVKRVVFGAFDPKCGAAGSRVDLFAPGLFNHDIEVTGGVLREECADILGEFFRQKRKRAKGGEE